MLPNHDRRAAPRVPFQAKVFLDAMGRRIDCRGSNLSATGMLLFPPARAGVGLAVRVHFVLPGTPQVNTVGGTLVRNGEVDGTYCLGVCFTDVSADIDQRIREFVAQRIAAFKGQSSENSTTGGDRAHAVGRLDNDETSAFGDKSWWAKRLRSVSAKQATVKRPDEPKPTRVGADTDPSGLSGRDRRPTSRRRQASSNRVGRETLRWGMIPDEALPTAKSESLIDELLDEDTTALQQRLEDIYKDAAAESKRQKLSKKK